MYNLIQSYIYDEKVLDLFAGSGSLGIEALSRGAESATFVEQNRQCKSIIEENLEKTRMVEKATILNTRVQDALRSLEQKKETFGLIIMDPPYNKGLITPVLKTIFERKLLDKEGIIVIEHEKNDILEDEVFSFRRIKCKHYGITTISIYKEADSCE